MVRACKGKASIGKPTRKCLGVWVEELRVSGV